MQCAHHSCATHQSPLETANNFFSPPSPGRCKICFQRAQNSSARRQEFSAFGGQKNNCTEGIVKRRIAATDKVQHYTGFSSDNRLVCGGLPIATVAAAAAEHVKAGQPSPPDAHAAPDIRRRAPQPYHWTAFCSFAFLALLLYQSVRTV
jgi:hypothetical protein